jgi:tripartite-type tricarboxylate transporter receptor subunit TctC
MIMNKKLIFMVLIIFGSMWLGIVNGVSGKEKDFPAKPIELICHTGAGGSTSLGGRVIGGTLSGYLGAPVVLINKPGGGGAVAPLYVARSKPDGYTLLIATATTMVIIPTIRSVGYKRTDFDLLALYGAEPLALVVKSDAPWKTLQELVEDAKKNPGKLKFATPGAGSSSHFSMELFKIAAGGLKIDHVPYKSGVEVVTSILGGHVHVSSLYMMDIKGSVDAGRLRMLAVSTEKRLEDYPNIPTFAELGYPEVKWTVWYGIAAPAGVPKEIADKLKEALYKTIKHPEVGKMLLHIGCNPTFKDADDSTEFVSEEEKKTQRIAREAGIRVD